MHFRIGTFNVMDLVFPGVPYYGRDPYTEAEYDEKLLWIGQQLRRMEAQIVGFQEVFHEEALQQACNQLDLYRHGTVIAPLTDGTRPRLGFATSLEVVGEPEVFKQFPEDLDLSLEGVELPMKNFNRPVLKVKVRLTKKHTLTVLMAHLKSKRPMTGGRDNDPKMLAIGHARSMISRAAEAAALRAILIDEIQNNRQPVVLIADLNDAVHSITSRIVSGYPPHRYLNLEEKQRQWDTLLYSTYEIQARPPSRDVNYSHIFNGEYEALDHIYVTQEFHRHNPRRIGEVELVQFFNDHVKDPTLTDEAFGKIISDHGQIVATLKMRHKH